MTEQDWLSCTDPTRMLGLLSEGPRNLARATNRKLRLFCCACCRQLWDTAPIGETGRYAVVTGEKLADGGMAASREEWQALIAARDKEHWPSPSWTALYMASAAIELDVVAMSREWVNRRMDIVSHHHQAMILRDIFGNPWRPWGNPWRKELISVLTANVPLGTRLFPHACFSWNDRALERMAQEIYDNRSFENMGILHDALIDSGCDDEDILGHCLEPYHTKGCWVLDLLMGRS